MVWLQQLLMKWGIVLDSDTQTIWIEAIAVEAQQMMKATVELERITSQAHLQVQTPTHGCWLAEVQREIDLLPQTTRLP